jgi:hypothetical protein
MKRIFLPIIFSFFVILYGVIQAEASIGKPKKIFSTPNEWQSFYGYLIKENVLYFGVSYNGVCKAYNYNDGKIDELNMDSEEAKSFLAETIPFSDESIDKQGNIRFSINDDISLRLEEWANGMYTIFVTKNGVEKDVMNDKYRCAMVYGYVYIDKENLKIYFNGATVRKSENNLLVYDIKNDKFYPINSAKNEAFANPIRIPNTSLIMYQGLGDSKGFDVYVQEIPEWKEEIEAQNKDKKEEVKQESSTEVKEEKKYVIDGPANLRDKAKGKKVVGELADKAEVKMLNKKGDWYEVESGEIKGWTFKDNVKEAE